ncbi:MAG: hypothetical protein ACRBBM_01605 [Pseudomonadaceae bacterium]
MKKSTYYVGQNLTRKSESTTKKPNKTTRLPPSTLASPSPRQYEAARAGDGCSNSTLASLSSFYGLAFIRTSETVPKRFLGTPPVIGYQFTESGAGVTRRALEALGNPRAITSVA